MTPKAAPLALTVLLVLPLAGGCDRLRPAPKPESTAKSEAEPEAEGDQVLALGLRVRLQLMTELGIDGSRVAVAAKDGRVRLGGEVRERATAEHAEQVARQVEGVRSVENKIRVAPAGTAPDTRDRADALIAETESELADIVLKTRVRVALVDRLGSDGLRIGTAAASGVVTLAFPPKMERARRSDAVRTAEGVEGVTRVVTLTKK